MYLRCRLNATLSHNVGALLMLMYKANLYASQLRSTHLFKPLRLILRVRIGHLSSEDIFFTSRATILHRVIRHGREQSL